MKSVVFAKLCAAAVVLAACATDGQYGGTARDAAIGGAIGAAGGAVIAGEGDRTRGAIIGGAIGAAAGALYGCTRDKVCPWSRDNPNHSPLYTDAKTGRKYFVDKSTGESFWEDGSYRGVASGN